MTTINAGLGRLLAGAGGALLIASLFLPWAELADGASRNGWELSTTLDVLCLIAGLFGIAAAITGGRFGFFRPDLSLNGTTDILGLVTAILLGWLVLFDFPSGASRDSGVYLALIGAIAVSCGAGDFRVTSFFPAIPYDDRRAP
jgi:hypothetical protein